MRKLIKESATTQNSCRESLKNKRLEAVQSTIFIWVRLLLIPILMILFINFVSALDFDNSLQYEDNGLKAKIINAFGFGEEIGSVFLTSHKSVDEIKKVEVGENIGVIRYDVEGNLQINDIEFINLNTGEEIHKEFKINKIEYTSYQVPIIKVTCSKENKEDCSTEIISYETRNKEIKIPITDLKIKDGTIIELSVEVNEGDYIDGIFTIEGKRIEQHAVWNATLSKDLRAVYDLEETDGSASNNTIEKVYGDYNLTIEGINIGTTQGKATYRLPLGYRFSGASNQGLNSTQFQNAFNSTNGTIIFWVEASESQSVDTAFISGGDSGVAGDTYYFGTVSGNVRMLVGNTIVFNDATTFYNSGDKFMIAFLWDTVQDRSEIYINDTSKGVSTTASAWDDPDFFAIGKLRFASGRRFNGNMSDIKIYNKTLSQNEITAHFNSGFGLRYNNLETVSQQITLTSPANNIEMVNKTSKFRANFETNANMTNATVFLWYQNSTLALKNTTSVSGSINNSNISLTNIPIAENLTWNIQLCSINSSGYGCSFAQTNRSFNNSAYIILSEVFNNVSQGGATEYFEMNISVYPDKQVSVANLSYNNTFNIGALIQNGSADIYSLQKMITVPTSSVIRNYTFFWKVVLNDGSEKNSTIRNQTADVLSIDDCSTNTKVLYNFTIKDENSQTTLNAVNQNTSGEVSIQIYSFETGTLAMNVSANYSRKNPFAVCLNSAFGSGLNYKADAQIKYDADPYSPEYYHIQKATLNLSTLYQNISLYDLDDASTTAFKITFKDYSFLAVKDALINIQRKYVGEGVFKSVEIPKTDAKGETVAHLKTLDTIYTFIVTKNGEILGTFDNIIAQCQSVALDECEINLNSFASSIGAEDFSQLDDFSYTLTYNTTSKVIRTIFTIPSGSVSTVLLNTTLYDNIGDTQLCADSLTSSAGTLTCTVPATFGNATVYVQLKKDGTQIAQSFLSLEDSSSDIYGANRVFLALILMITLIGVGVQDSPMLTGFFLFLGAILLIGLNIIESFSWIGAGATILWLLIAILLVLIKGARRS